MALTAVGACGEVDVDERQGGDVVTAASALATSDFTDASGQVHVRVTTCDWTTSATGSRCAYCAVASDWLLIGGGAEIDGSPASARLRASYPYPTATPPSSCAGNGANNRELTVWLARSYGSTSHRLRAYAVGLKIDGMTADEIIGGGYIRQNESTSTYGSAPTKDTPPASSNLVVVGGGAELLSEIGTEPNGYLTELRPIGPNAQNLGWNGSSVFDGQSQGAIKVFSIGLAPCLPVPGWTQCLDWKWRTITTGPASGYGAANVATPYPWVTAGVGVKGITGTATTSRYLADMIPLSGSSQGVTGRTKDEGTTVSGTTTAFAFNLMKGAGLWTYNSIRFNTPGTALSRPTGTAPVTLQQSTSNPDASARRWHLESRGSGQYRIRHGNPGSGTECACRISGTLNVRVTTCGTSTNCLWTIEGQAPGAGTFKLKNVANEKCIDNNGQGSTTSNLVFRTCDSGYSANQSLFVDRYSWPP